MEDLADLALAHRHRTAVRTADQVLDDLEADGLVRRLRPHDPGSCSTCAQVGVVKVLDRMLAAVGELCELRSTLPPDLAGQIDRAVARLVEGLDRVADVAAVDRATVLADLEAIPPTVIDPEKCCPDGRYRACNVLGCEGLLRACATYPRCPHPAPAEAVR